MTALLLSSACSDSPAGNALARFDLRADTSTVLSDGDGVSRVCAANDSAVVFMEQGRYAVTVLGAHGPARWGRRGGGPGEFQHPVGVLCSYDGGFWVAELGMRLHRFRDDGSFDHTTAVVLGEATLVTTIHGTGPGVVFYAVESSFASMAARGSSTGAGRDSTRVWRINADSMPASVVALMKPVEFQRLPADAGHLTIAAPFQVRDYFIPMPEGGFAVFRGDQLQLDVYSGAEVQAIPLSGLRRVLIPEQARDSARRAWQEHSNPSFRGLAVTLPALYPPVLGVWLDQSQNFWLQVPDTAHAGRFLVLSSASKQLLAEVDLPADSRLVGFDSHAAYMVREGIEAQELLRVELPHPLKPRRARQ